MADSRKKKTRRLTISIDVSSDVKEPSEHELILITAAATSAMANYAKEKGLTLDHLETNG